MIVSDLDSVGLALHSDGECAELPGLTPNEAPHLGGVVHVEEETEQALPSGVTIPVAAGETAVLEPLWNPDDQEIYYHVDWGGLTDCRTEQPFFGWFATGGSFTDRDGFPADNSFLDEAGFPDPMQWQAPRELPDRNPIDAWIETCERDVRDCRWAIAQRDFQTLATIVENNCLAMHSCMMATRPPLLYWQPATLAVIHAVRQLRSEGVECMFTIDAGPSVVVLAPVSAIERVGREIGRLQGVSRVTQTRIGGGAHLVPNG